MNRREFLLINYIKESLGKINRRKALKLGAVGLLGTQLGSIGSANAIGMSGKYEITRMLKSLDQIEKVHFMKLGSEYLVEVTDFLGEKHSHTIKTSIVDNIKIEKVSSILNSIVKKNTFENDPAFGIQDFFDKIKELEDKADSDQEMSYISKELASLEKTDTKSLKRLYSKFNYRSDNSKINMDEMTLTVVARRLADEDGIALPKSKEGRILYVKALFDKELRRELKSFLFYRTPR